MDEEIQRRKLLTFEQAEGVEAIPSQFKLKDLSAAAKAKLWQGVYEMIKNSEASHSYAIRDPLRSVALQHFVEVEHGYADEFDPHSGKVSNRWKPYFSQSAPYYLSLGLVQFLLRRIRYRKLIETTEDALRLTAYKLVDNDTIVPVASEHEEHSFRAALDTLQNQEANGARSHMLKAAGLVSTGSFADSVRESIHAVESAVRSATGKRKFQEAVNALNEQRPMHEAFRRALGNLYGYTSDEQGIRHPILEKGDANVSQRDALFMLGLCASFITFLFSAD